MTTWAEKRYTQHITVTNGDVLDDYNALESEPSLYFFLKFSYLLTYLIN